MQKIAIIGLGLLGGSLGIALKDKNVLRLGWARRKETRDKALKRGVVDECPEDINDVISQADISVLCLPIPCIIEFGKKYASFFKKGSVVTDIGSVKTAITDPLEKALSPHGVFFIGSHPMAGTEKSGIDAALAELYNDASVFVTKTEQSDPAAFEKIKDFWKSIKMRIVEIGTLKHDDLVAHTSHLQHVAALAITEAVLDCDPDTLKQRYAGCAGGFKDTSRITSSSPQMWREIIEHNQPAVLQSVKEFEKRWLNIIKIIENKDYDALYKEFAKGKKMRDAWVKFRGF